MGWGPKSKKIQVKYLTDITKLYKSDEGDWIDLRAATDVFMMAGQYFEIGLGVSIKLPEGYEAIIAPRSSTFKRHGVLMAGSIGVIDERYCGPNDEWKFPAYATRDTVIPKDARICQFRILRHQPELEFEEIEEMLDDDRGGLGSSGV